MGSEEFEFVIGPDGDVEMTTHNVKGKRCLEYLEFFQQLLGEARDVVHKPEYYEPEVALDGEVDLHLHQHLKR